MTSLLTREITVLDPRTGETVGRVPIATPQQCDDSLFGSAGTADRVFGGAGSDLCIAEFEKDCER